VRRNFRAWDCKVTPADSSCQEINTTGCIPSNDGLDAGFEPRFPHCGKHKRGVICRIGHFGIVSHGRGWDCRGFLTPLPGLFNSFENSPRLTPFRQAQGGLWAAFLRRPSTPLRAGFRGWIGVLLERFCASERFSRPSGTDHRVPAPCRPSGHSLDMGTPQNRIMVSRTNASRATCFTSIPRRSWDGCGRIGVVFG
jgi:hypothetical protein